MDLARAMLDHEPALRRYARALTRDAVRADDLLQDTWLRALAKAHLYQPDTNLRAWLFTIMHNQFVNWVRRAVREGSAVDVASPGLVEHYPALQVAPAAIRNIEVAEMRRVLALLPAPMRDVLYVVAECGERYDAAAAALDVPLGTVRSRLSRARALLAAVQGRPRPDAIDGDIR